MNDAINTVTSRVFWNIVLDHNERFGQECRKSEIGRLQVTPEVWWELFLYFVKCGRLPDVDVRAQFEPAVEPKPEPEPEPEVEFAVGPKPTSPFFGPRDA